MRQRLIPFVWIQMRMFTHSPERNLFRRRMNLENWSEKTPSQMPERPKLMGEVRSHVTKVRIRVTEINAANRQYLTSPAPLKAPA